MFYIFLDILRILILVYFYRMNKISLDVVWRCSDCGYVGKGDHERVYHVIVCKTKQVNELRKALDEKKSSGKETH